MMIRDLTINQVRGAFDSMQYTFYEDKPNIFGIRDENKSSNKFNDIIGWALKTNNEWVVKVYKGTTDPGETSLVNPVNKAGCAILVEDQYVDVYGIGMHQGKYEALCQINGSVRVYRDNTRDSVMDFDAKTIQSGFFGINIHRANAKIESVIINDWSAGCQVISDPKNFNELMAMCRSYKESLKNKFTYTLFTEEEFYG